MKRQLICLNFLLTFILLVGCSNTGNGKIEEISPEHTEANKEQEYIQYLVEHYDFKKEDFDEMDVVAFVEAYDLVADDCTSEEAHEIYEDSADMYRYTEMDRLYGFIDKDTDYAVKKDDKIVRIGVYLNEGVFAQKKVFDLTQKAYYTDDTNSVALSAEAIEKLSTIVSRYEVDAWEKTPEFTGTDTDSTANYAWRIVFATEDGRNCSYYGGLGYNDPKHSAEVIEELMKLI